MRTVHRINDQDTAALLGLVRRRPQHVDTLAATLGASRSDVLGWVDRLNAAGHSIPIDIDEMVRGR